MPENKTPPSKGFDIDWLVRGVLAKAGDAFDNFTGRKWQPSSNLATSQIIEKLKALVDSQVRDLGPKGRFVPNNIRLKVEWETFGSESGELLETLGRELTVALIDHINDCRYHTFAPIDLQVRADYFTEGIRLTVGFDDPGQDELELEIGEPSPAPAPPAEQAAVPPAGEKGEESAVRPVARELRVRHGGTDSVVTVKGGERIYVGRGSGNSVDLQHPSVSKSHAVLVFDGDGVLKISDLGSTNGTSVADERIEPGKLVTVPGGTEVMLGELAVRFDYGDGPEAEGGTDE